MSKFEQNREIVKNAFASVLSKQTTKDFLLGEVKDYVRRAVGDYNVPNGFLQAIIDNDDLGKGLKKANWKISDLLDVYVATQVVSSREELENGLLFVEVKSPNGIDFSDGIGYALEILNLCEQDFQHFFTFKGVEHVEELDGVVYQHIILEHFVDYRDDILESILGNADLDVDWDSDGNVILRG